MAFGIYVHIPFCKKKCDYCNFYSETKHEQINEYLIALISEIKQQSKNYVNKTVDTIFIGGGTPSILPSGGIGSILTTIKQNFKVKKNCEITMEANPNSINYTNANEWFLNGVNRISVGVQSTINRLLKKIGRSHNASQFFKAIDNLKKVGFKNINADVMIGLPTQKQGDLKKTLRQIGKLELKHISIYTLILEPDTELYEKVESGVVKLPKEEKVLGMFNFALKQTELLGYNRYEVSNFSYPGFECKHNQNCWQLQNYVGFGCAAHSFVEDVRFGNISNVKQYIHNINNNISVQEFSEKITNQELFEEYVMLGLRCADGIDLNKIKKEFGINLKQSKKNDIDHMLYEDLIEIHNSKLKVTKHGYNVLNQIILSLI